MAEESQLPEGFNPREHPLFKASCARIEAAVAVARTYGEEVEKAGGVHNQVTADRAAEVLSLISDVRAEIEDNRKAMVQRAHEEKQVTDKAFREIRGPVEGIEAALKSTIAQFNREQREKTAEEQARLEEEAAEEQAIESEAAADEGREPEEIRAPEAVAPETSRLTSSARVSGSQIRKYRVIDFSAMPDEFKQPDKGALNRAAKSGRDNVPGVEFYLDENISVTKR